MRVLTLPVKRIYFEQIDRGEKLWEYRLQTEYWAKRLEGREYDLVTITLGYPKRDDHSRRISFKWGGVEKHKITHPHFGNIEREVYAIAVDPKLRQPRPS